MSMLSLRGKSRSDLLLEAAGRSQIIAEMDTGGRILRVNANFRSVYGYAETDIIGRHHDVLLDPQDAKAEAQTQFWSSLNSGQSQARRFRHIARDGRDIWVEASYCPVMRNAKVIALALFATDITALRLRSAEDTSKIRALTESQTVIEFAPDGIILTANENFLRTFGYSLGEIVGRHHSILCQPDAEHGGHQEGQSCSWADLTNGKPVTGEFVRIARDGRRIHVQATYNPILDTRGKVFKVMQFATDVTPRVRNVEALGEALENLSKGDLTARLDQPFIPALERLRANFNETVERLGQTIRNLEVNSRAIASGSSEVRQAADDLAKRTQHQAAAVEQTAAAVAQIASTVEDSSRKAEDVGRLVSGAHDNADKAGAVVGKAITAMEEIERSSRQISSIIGVIDEIAFQTNLLALNAGVEAARAGEAGRGFAVVAQEVRELAQRSAQAARQIKSLISDSGRQVADGVVLVGETGTVLREIAGQVQNINGHVRGIVEAAREQASGLREINTAVGSIDEHTQQNAAMVEEAHAASHGLAREADSLFGLVSQFRLDGQNARMAGPTAVPPSGYVTGSSTGLSVSRSTSPARALQQRLGTAMRAPAVDPHEAWEEF